MARKKERPKPMNDLRGDFVASLENLCQQSLNLIQTIDMVTGHEGIGEKIPDAIKKILSEHADAVRMALTGKYESKAMGD